jgi:hypothetical protein
MSLRTEAGQLTMSSPARAGFAEPPPEQAHQRMQKSRDTTERRRRGSGAARVGLRLHFN